MFLYDISFSPHSYVLTTVLEEPFLSLSQSSGYVDDDVNDKYEGYVKDLAAMIAQDIGVSFEIRPARDGKYGNPDKTERGEAIFFKWRA